MSKRDVSLRINAQEFLAQHKAEMKKKYGSKFDLRELADRINDASGLHLTRQAYDAIARKSSLPRLSTAKAIMTYADILERKTKYDVAREEDINGDMIVSFLNNIDDRLKEVVELLKKKIESPA